MAISLKAARVNADMTQIELAKELGVSKVTIWMWETGKSEPRVSQFQELCRVCKVDPFDVFLPKT